MSVPTITDVPLDHEVRPWGSWQVLDQGEGYKVKSLTVDPHARLSLQKHAHRAEHWFVVSGTALCTVGVVQNVATVGDHVFVPLGAVHRITNAGDEPLLILEVQVGISTSEDDIIRLQDDHGRA